MTLLVPFDGTELAEAALQRADEFSDLLGEEVIVLSVVPKDAQYARGHGWLDVNEEFDTDLVCTRLEEQAKAIATDITFRCEHPADRDERASMTTNVIRTIRDVASDIDPSILFIGSENAGQVATPITSVGSPVSEDPRYDVHIVRHPVAEDEE
ncbi:universal stress protein [Salinarchaeum sp. IM2453]|uniref:universal stress protein n=1 Tax=Salinarchaeum sp. IM2453 TaxID=2862870 RepID=UPI001C82B108|nr:universal stress protein [Salinarchaeum sp. IM2453]QZA89002.1 universal stress protein [Salinarchaeum sp. IM2453]